MPIFKFTATDEQLAAFGRVAKASLLPVNEWARGTLVRATLAAAKTIKPQRTRGRLAAYRQARKSLADPHANETLDKWCARGRAEGKGAWIDDYLSWLDEGAN